MSDLTPAAQRWLADHHGVITAAALRDAAVGRATISRLVDAGTFRRAAKGVYVVASAPRTVEQRCAVLCAAHPAGFVTGPTAGRLAGLRRMPQSSALHLSVRHGAHLPQEPGVHFRQTTVLWTIDRQQRVTASSSRHGLAWRSTWPPISGPSTTSRWSTSCSTSNASRPKSCRRSGAGSLIRPDRVRRRSGGRWPPSGVISQRVPSGSRAPEALRRRGLPVEPQVRVIRPSSGLPARIDLAVPAARWGIELDIHPEHRSLDGHAADAARRRDMHHIGWQIETVAEADMQDPERLADDLVGLYLIRRRQLLDRPSAS